MDAHIEMTESTSDLAKRLEQDTRFQAICNGDSRAMSRLQREGSIQTTIGLRRETPLGQRQVESLLRFMISEETTRAFEDAEGDNLVYDSLGEHRILGRAKKKKKKMRTTSY